MLAGIFHSRLMVMELTDLLRTLAAGGTLTPLGRWLDLGRRGIHGVGSHMPLDPELWEWTPPPPAGGSGTAVGHGGGKKVARPEAVLGTLRSLTGGTIMVVGSGETSVQIQ